MNFFKIRTASEDHKFLEIDKFEEKWEHVTPTLRNVGLHLRSDACTWRTARSFTAEFTSFPLFVSWNFTIFDCFILFTDFPPVSFSKFPRRILIGWNIFTNFVVRKMFIFAPSGAGGKPEKGRANFRGNLIFEKFYFHRKETFALPASVHFGQWQPTLGAAIFIRIPDADLISFFHFSVAAPPFSSKNVMISIFSKWINEFFPLEKRTNFGNDLLQLN